MDIRTEENAKAIDILTTCAINNIPLAKYVDGKICGIYYIEKQYSPYIDNNLYIVNTITGNTIEILDCWVSGDSITISYAMDIDYTEEEEDEYITGLVPIKILHMDIYNNLNIKG